MPPQAPACGFAAVEVNLMGSAALPSAAMVPSIVMPRFEPTCTSVPPSMLSLAPAATVMLPVTQTGLSTTRHSVSCVMLPVTDSPHAAACRIAYCWVSACVVSFVVLTPIR